MNSLKIEHINPDGLIKNPAFTNVVTVQGNAKTIYIGEINANNAAGEVIGKGDLKVQAEQVMKNIETALHAAGADWENLIKWTIYLVHGQDIQPGFEAFQKFWGKRPNPPLITVLFVPALGRPEHLLGIEAIAVVP
ncbi:RidA family protein [Chitinophaga sp. SYP-B3965]|uniref:RidA family protein n=1 Tax=Chitinophaga sp. SYP-B3965 TaxID=2663120 RepID=UPI0012999800|nr:RidA family protein [Chitinophaga sp. SYP-B3965]MRG47973.1 RidA family protein [Chitinophaga sp. SYP-B3965]